jgi:hypothetical protein
VKVADFFCASPFHFLKCLSSFPFHLVPKPRREFQVGRMPFLGHHNSVATLIWSMVHPMGLWSVLIMDTL